MFATLVNKWKNNMSFPEFCDKILELYGPPRKHLLADMRPFVPESDRPYFEAFLERVGLPSQSSWHTLANEPTMYARPLRRQEQQEDRGAPQYSLAASRDSLLLTGSLGNLDIASSRQRGGPGDQQPQSTDSYVPKKT